MSYWDQWWDADGNCWPSLMSPQPRWYPVGKLSGKEAMEKVLAEWDKRDLIQCTASTSEKSYP